MYNDIKKGDEVMRSGKYVWAAIYTLLLSAFTLYACLDTFVIQRVYEVPDQPVTKFTLGAQNSETSGGTAEASDTAETDPSDTTDTAGTENAGYAAEPDVKITEYRYNDTTVYVADIVLSSPDQLKTALARSSYGKNVTEKTSDIAANNGALLAINGDYYGARERGYVIREGIIYRSTRRQGAEDLVIYRDGTMKIISESDVSAEELLNDGAYNVFSFGPGLISDGVITVSEGYEVGQAMSSNPRTAIGQVDGLHYVFVVSDGRTSESAGLSLYELAQFMSELGVSVAYNLDGGGSSTMYYNGEVVNNPTTNGKRISERSVSDIVYIGY